MNTPNAEIAEVLNDLVAINNDRVKGYERAIAELKDEDADLKPLFLSIIEESRKAKADLMIENEHFGGDITGGTTINGKIYRAWMDVNAVFTRRTRQTILENC